MLIALPSPAERRCADQINWQVRTDVHPPERNEPGECRERNRQVVDTLGHVTTVMAVDTAA
jgi:hypothetical protein